MWSDYKVQLARTYTKNIDINVMDKCGGDCKGVRKEKNPISGFRMRTQITTKI